MVFWKRAAHPNPIFFRNTPAPGRIRSTVCLTYYEQTMEVSDETAKQSLLIHREFQLYIEVCTHQERCLSYRYGKVWLNQSKLQLSSIQQDGRLMSLVLHRGRSQSDTTTMSY